MVRIIINLTFRLDGLFYPQLEAADKPFYLVEVQFQPDNELYYTGIGFTGLGIPRSLEVSPDGEFFALSEPAAKANITVTTSTSDAIQSIPLTLRKTAITTKAVRLLPSTKGWFFPNPQPIVAANS